MVAGYVYTRDAVGNPTGVSLSDGNLLTFSYDDAYRLTREQRSGAAAYDITYSYDSTGNRTGKLSGGVTTTYTFDAADRLTVENAGGTLTTYSFDAAGNNTVVNAAGALTTYAWDLTNRMTGLADASGVTTLVYDATGLRRAKQDASGTTQFLWDGQTLLLEADAGGTTQAHYTAAPGGYGPTVAQRRGTTSSFYHPTDLGTIENLTDASGNVTDTYAFTAFGVPVTSSGSTTNPHRYIGALGYYTDPTTGLNYVRARYLRPTTGSWLSEDPVEGEPRYQYVGGSPVGESDPAGLRRPVGPDAVKACWSRHADCLKRAQDGYYQCLAIAGNNQDLREHCGYLHEQEIEQCSHVLQMCLGGATRPCRVYVEWVPAALGHAHGRLCIQCQGDQPMCKEFLSGPVGPGAPGYGSGGVIPPGTHLIHLPAGPAGSTGVGSYVGQPGMFIGVDAPGRPGAIVAPGGTIRTSIGIHWDANAGSQPGTVGCIGIQGEANYCSVRDFLCEITGGSGTIPIDVPPCPSVR